MQEVASMPTTLERDLAPNAALARRARVAGGISLLLCGVLAKICVIDLLREAERHQAKELTISSGVALIPPLAIIGAIMLIAGKHVVGFGKRLGLERRPDGSHGVAFFVFVGVAVVPGLVLYYWLEQRVAGLGYGN